ncbi:MAG: methyl-accepting chemotaxis protein [Candidatus Riflebacteria bacterium]|nr:methyl-accepting chemotaxis protein [Candidatus Riflebacteria bacterium]
MSQRKNYFIAKDMQSKFAGTILLLAFLVAVITACNIYVLGSYFVSTSTTLVEARSLSATLQHFVTEFWPRLMVLIFVNVIIVFIVSVMYSHQTAGPAYKLEKSIKRISDGDLTFEVSLRRNDNLKELAVALNELLKKFRVTLAKAKTLSDDIAIKLDGLESDDKFKLLAANAAELSELIKQFKIEGAGVDSNTSVVIELDEEVEDAKENT